MERFGRFVHQKKFTLDYAAGIKASSRRVEISGFRGPHFTDGRASTLPRASPA